MKRGEIYYVERSSSVSASGSEMYAGRPAIIVSNEKNNANSTVFEVVYLTTQPKQDLPTHVSIRSVKRNSIALCEQVTSVSEERIGDYIGTCSNLEMQQIDIALAISLGIDINAEKPVDAVKEVTNDTIVRIETERDVYRKLYEQMLERMVRV